MNEASKQLVVQALQKHADFQNLLNPVDLIARSERVFTGFAGARDLLRQFTINEFVYHTMHAVRASPEMEAAAKEAGWRIHTDLKVHVAIPSALVGTSEAAGTWIPFVRWHRGGGVSEKCVI